MLCVPTRQRRSNTTPNPRGKEVNNTTANNPNALQMNSLEIKRNMYGFDYGNVPAGAMAGKISFSNTKGHEMTLVLTPEQIQRILGIISEAMVETTRELANGLTKDIIENTPLSIGSDTP